MVKSFMRPVLTGMALAGFLSASAATVVYVYDALGRVVRVEYPSGQRVCYAYDAAGSISAITTATAPASC